MTATLLPNGEQVFIDDDGVPLALGRVYFYTPNTDTPKNTWQDSSKSTLNTNPVTLDAAGRAVIYGDGLYRQVLKDVDGNQIWDKPTSTTALLDSGVVAGDYTNADITVNSLGIITEASNGTGGSGSAHGQCLLQYTNSSTITLVPYNGNSLIINSTSRTVPSAGVTFSASGLGTSTKYYIYAYMSGSTMTLEASVTAYTTQSATGVVIKSGDATRTLVGCIYSDSDGPNFKDDTNHRFTRSWFNDWGITGSGAFSSDRSTTSTTPTEINTEIRLQYLLWNKENTFMGASIEVTSATTPLIRNAICINNNDDTGGNNSRFSTSIPIANNDQCASHSWNFAASSGETLNYLTLVGWVNSGTGTWRGDNGQTNIRIITNRR